MDSTPIVFALWLLGLADMHTVATEIVEREGGFVNDPDDLGGATKHGVTLKTLRRLDFDANHDGVINIADIRRLSRPQAVHIFMNHYYFEPEIDRLPWGLRASVFDMYVHSGGNAVVILQRLLNNLTDASLKIDGVIGPNTQAACREALDKVGLDRLRDSYAISRREYYYRLAAARPANLKYVSTQNGNKGGWIKRAEEFMSEEHRYSVDQHRDKIRRIKND